MELLRFNPRKLQEWREKARTSLYFFQRALWGDRDLDPVLHLGLCNFLQQDHLRFMVCGFRGSLKSSSVIAWLVWKGLYGPAAGKPLAEVAAYVEREGLDIEVVPGVCIPNWSAKLIEQREANARRHHLKIQEKFQWGATASLLQDTYETRIPPGFTGWTTGAEGRTIFVRTDPNADPFLTHAGLDSKLESAHVEAIVGDDLEGADADKSDAPNAESEKFVMGRAEPLLRDPRTGQIGVVGTPHGGRPLVWKVRRLADAAAKAGEPSKYAWRYWWRPLVNDAGESAWPSRFDQAFVAKLYAEGELSSEAREKLDKQYLLRESSGGANAFDLDRINQNQFDRSGRLLTYQTTKFDQPRPENQFKMTPRRSEAHIDLAYTYRFLHLDPKHKDPLEMRASDRRRSEWAILATAVAPDGHVFLVEEWVKDATFDEAVAQFFKMYRLWQPKLWSIDPVGAQTWFNNYLRLAERGQYSNLVSIPTQWSPIPATLAKPSKRMIPAHRSGQGKGNAITGNLEVPLHTGLLHVNQSIAPATYRQIEQFGVSETDPIDAIDALAQGPSVWCIPPAPDQQKALAWKAHLSKLLESTGLYTRPWNEAA